MLRKRDNIEEWFREYTGSFIFDSYELQRNIDLKTEHTYRVRDEIVYLAGKLGISDDDTALAEITAILHDVGRFEQFRKFRTFSDRDSVNHAELGIEIIKEGNVLREFAPESENLILKSILYHNRAFLPEKENERVIFFSKLLRDADKLDIWKVVLEYYSKRDISKNSAIVLGLPDTEGISPEVYEDLMSHSIVNMANVKNVNDFKLLQAGWVFDINFKPALEQVVKREYITRLRSSLPDTGEIEVIFNEIDGYIVKRFKSTVSPAPEQLF
ncbi:MAG TPA: HD domain-containing protein [Spirochaetota bacterium]|mgnify:CR=1 FL=1|nr:HD domain-containing protein [Spirochaetota bacterium]HPJ35666.1 HD domain-containing protein [Spirochaetota bacterium]